MPFKIENDAICMRETLADQIGAVRVLESHPDNGRFVLQYSADRHLQVIESADEMHLAIWDKATDEMIGYTILAGITNPNRSLELRRLVIQSKGQGFGRQALRLIKQYCFEELRSHRLWLDVYEDNARAIHLYETEGFVKEGMLRESFKDDMGYRSQCLYSMLESEYDDHA